MHYIDTTTGHYPLTQLQIRSAHPNTVFPEPFEPCEGYALVAETPPPAHDPDTHHAVEGEPVQHGEQWHQTWTIAARPDGDIGAQLDAEIARLTRAATARRWEVETGGVALPGGLQVDSTTEDQNRITSVIANAELAGVTTVDFKAGSGWVTLTIAELQGIAAAIALHVQACFSAERAHHEAIAVLASLPEARAYDLGQGWPATAAFRQGT